MGTSALTLVLDEDNCVLVRIYTHYDGYPEGHGKILQEFIDGIKIVPSANNWWALNKEAAGMGCFAAQLIAHLKTCVGNTYLSPREDEANFTYYISKGNNNKVILTNRFPNVGLGKAPQFPL